MANSPTPNPPLVDAAPGVGSLRTLGPGADQAAAGNDSRFGEAALPDPSAFPDGATPVVRAGAWVYNTRLTVNDIDAAFAVSGFSGTGGYVSILELGAAMTNPGFSVSYNQTPTSASINDGSGASALSSPFTSFTFSKTYTHTTISSVNFTITGVKGTVSSSAGISTSWVPKCYFGAAADPGTYTSSFITSLASNALAGGRQRNITTTTGAGQYVFYGFDTAFGGAPGNFIDASTGFAFGVSKVTTISVTNTNGVVVSIDLWRSDYPNLGTTTMEVQ